jgi:hypothetical protein
MNCLPGTPCFNGTTVYQEDCGLDLCGVKPNSTDLTLYTGPNLPCLGVDTCNCTTDVISVIDDKLCPENLATAFLSAISTIASVNTTFCQYVSGCLPTTTTTSSSTSTTSTTSSTSTTSTTSSTTSTTTTIVGVEICLSSSDLGCFQACQLFNFGCNIYYISPSCSPTLTVGCVIYTDIHLTNPAMNGSYSDGVNCYYMAGDEIIEVSTCASATTTTTSTSSTSTTTTSTSSTTSTSTTAVPSTSIFLGYSIASCATACEIEQSTYYVSTVCETLNYSCAIYLNPTLTSIAPDGFYSDGTNCYTVSGGVITNVNICSGPAGQVRFIVNLNSPDDSDIVDVQSGTPAWYVGMDNGYPPVNRTNSPSTGSINPSGAFTRSINVLCNLDTDNDYSLNLTTGAYNYTHVLNRITDPSQSVIFTNVPFSQYNNVTITLSPTI